MRISDWSSDVCSSNLPVIFEYYGSTEAGPLTFCGSDDWLAHRGTVGRPIEGVRLSIRGAAGKPCGAGEAVEFCIDETFQPNFTYQQDAEKRGELEVTSVERIIGKQCISKC